MPSLPRRSCVSVVFAATSMLVAAVSNASAHESLYARMGGHRVVAAFVSDTIDQVVADPRLNSSFRDVDTNRVKRELTTYICRIAGGGCKYTGVPIREVHANLGITQAQFFGLVQIMRRDMRLHHVGLRERNQLLALLAPLEPKVVDVKIPPPSRKN
jgi:hemoglobin